MDENRFQLLLLEHLPDLQRIARYFAGNTADADDLVQAACERALLSRDQFQEGTRFDSWMYRNAQTKWLDLLKAREVRKGPPLEEAPLEWQGSNEAMRQAEARVELRQTGQAIAQLPQDQRITLLLIAVEGLSYKEAAVVSNVPIGTIVSRMARARAKLHRALPDAV